MKIGGIDLNRVRKVPTVTDPLHEPIARTGRTDITLAEYIASADDVTDQSRALAHTDAETILAAIAGIPPVVVTLTDAQIALLGTSVVDAFLKRMGGTA